MFNFNRTALCLTLMLVGVPISNAGIILPTPGSVLDGIQTTVFTDDFATYSTDILQQLQANGFTPAGSDTYVINSGTGGLDVLLYTGAQGQTNQGIGPGGVFDFENPVIDSGGNITSFDGWWGQNDQDNDGAADVPSELGPVTVGNVLAYLEAIDPDATIPAFYLDLNQTGGQPQLDLVGQVQIIDPDTDVVVASWALDSNFQPGDGVFDIDAPVRTPEKNNNIPGTNNVYSIDPNKGSGKADFIAIAPTMDLRALVDADMDISDYLFVVEFHFGDYAGHPGIPIGDTKNLNNGFEEVYLAGGFTFENTPVIPEPTTLVIFSCVALLVSPTRRRR